MTAEKKRRNSTLLVLTAFIWGVAFVAQSEGGRAVGPYTFNFVRFLLGALVLLPVIRLSDRLEKNKKQAADAKTGKPLITGGIFCGVLLFLGSSLQQLGLYYGAAAGKAGFLTACYILLVPILGLFLKKKCGLNVWLGVAIALAGLYLLCMQGSFSLRLPDILLLFGALAFSFHILVIDHFSPLVDGVRMSAIQFLVAGLFSAIPMLAVDIRHASAHPGSWAKAFASPGAWITILYAGVLSCGVAYTLQIIGQNGLRPAIAALLMSLESVFSVLAGWLILHETLTPRELSGCVLLFAAILLAQLPARSKNPANPPSQDPASDGQI